MIKKENYTTLEISLPWNKPKGITKNTYNLIKKKKTKNNVFGDWDMDKYA